MNRAGMTLLETLVALLITAIVVTTGGQLFAGEVDALARLRADRQRRGEATLRRSWLERTVRSLSVGQVGGHPFEGRAQEVQFSARLLTGDGWYEAGSVRIAMQGNSLRAWTESGDAPVLATGVSSVVFEYLTKPGLDSKWTKEWRSPVSAPEAIRLRIVWEDPARVIDTLLLLVGSRG